MNEVIKHLQSAIDAHSKGLTLFNNSDYSAVPPDKEEEIMQCCSECGRNFKTLREELDPTYRGVYQTFYDGGMETDCRIGKNRWCFGLIEFAKARLKDLKG